MICQVCNKPFYTGDVAQVERVNGSDHFFLYHPECYQKRRAQQEEAEDRIENAARMARKVH